MYSYAPGPQVLDVQNTADHVSPEIVKHQDLPYRFPVTVKYWHRFCDSAIRRRIMIANGVFLYHRVIQVE